MMLPILAITQVLYTYAYTGAGLEAEINSKIRMLEKSIESHQQLNIREIKIRDHLCAFIVYEIIDKSEK